MTTSTTTRLEDLLAAHADLRARYHQIGSELDALQLLEAQGELAEDDFYPQVDALIAEREQNIQRDEAMRPEIHQLTREQSEAKQAPAIIRVSRINTGPLEVALQGMFDDAEMDSEGGERVKIAATYVEGTAEALDAAAYMAEAHAEEVFEMGADCWMVDPDGLWRELLVKRQIQAVRRAVAKIRHAIR